MWPLRVTGKRSRTRERSPLSRTGGFVRGAIAHRSVAFARVCGRAGGPSRGQDARPPFGPPKLGWGDGCQQGVVPRRTMIQVTPHMRILVAVDPADFRKGIDGLARICREALKQDPFAGGVFVFRNTAGSRYLCKTIRPHQGRAVVRPRPGDIGSGERAKVELRPHQSNRRSRGPR
jgi:hypothetical protein